MKFDIDSYQEILDTITRNKTRSFLTGFGVFWGVFMLVSLIGGGQGLRELLSNNFKGFANNAAIVVAYQTSKPYMGLKKGRWWALEYSDMVRIKQQVQGLDVVTPVLSKNGRNVTAGEKTFNCTVNGVLPDYSEIETPTLSYGRFINNMDIQQNRKVCVLGKKVYKNLFPGGGDPCGQRVKIDDIYYDIVGVNASKGNISINGTAEEKVVMPLTMMQKAYNNGDTVGLLCFTGRPGVVMNTVVPKVRQVIARAHNIDPTDQKAMIDINTEVMFSMVDNLFSGVNFLILLVGIGTLLAGAIGVSNIMMVSVRERTTEIGIRRAIGATPKAILWQIIAESVSLTTAAGMCGILFSVGVLQMLELANTADGVVSAHFQVRFLTALSALVLLGLLGVLAGLAPALRAMSVKPVDAMRDE